MERYWIRLWRKIDTNDVFFDDKALRVLIYLICNVDRKTGSMTIGRFWLSERLRFNSNTIYKVLKRLEKKYKIVTQSSNNKFTTITLLNWAKYQPTNNKVTQDGNNKVTTKEQQSNTLQEVENKELKNIPKGIKNFGNSDINEVSSYFLQVMQIPKEDCTQRQSRQYWHLLLKESKKGVEGVKWLVNIAHKDKMLAPNIPSSKDLYYKRVKLLTRIRGSRPSIEFEGGDKRVEINSGN